MGAKKNEFLFKSSSGFIYWISRDNEETHAVKIVKDNREIETLPITKGSMLDQYLASKERVRRHDLIEIEGKKVFVIPPEKSITWAQNHQELKDQDKGKLINKRFSSPSARTRDFED